MNKELPPAIILGLGVNGLGIARSLGMYNVPIFGLYNKREEIGRFSKYLMPIKVSNLKQEPDALLQQLIELGHKINTKAFLIPESDGYTSFISENRELLSKFFLFNIPRKELLNKILEKNGNMELAQQNDVLIPKTIYIKDKSDIDRVLSEFKLPIIIKPLNTFSAYLPGNKKNIVIDDYNLLLRLITDNSSLFGSIVIQELIIGLDGNIVVCSVYFSLNSEPLGVYTGRKIRQYRPDYGVTCYGVSEYIPEIEEISVRLLKNVGYRGLGTLEFAQDITNGKYYFLEINGRSFYHNMLFTDCSVNLSYIAYCDSVGLAIQNNYERQKNGLYWIDFTNDLGSFREKYRDNKIKITEWLFSLFKARSFAVFNKADIRPFLYSTFLLIESLFKKIMS